MLYWMGRCCCNRPVYTSAAKAGNEREVLTQRWTLLHPGIFHNGELRPISVALVRRAAAALRWAAAGTDSPSFFFPDSHSPSSANVAGSDFYVEPLPDAAGTARPFC